MAISIKSTAGLHTNGVKLLVYGLSGAGKTSLIKTLPSPLILSAEGGLLSLSGSDIPFIEIGSIGDLKKAYDWLTQSQEAMQFQSIAIDSISEIGEVVLNKEKKDSKDQRQAYGAMQEVMQDVIRQFRDLPSKNVYMTAKLEKAQDEVGNMLYYPSIPSNKAAQGLPYFFDEVLALRVEKDNEGNTHRALMCDSDGRWTAKDRSGKLSFWESPDLGLIINKIMGVAQ